MTTSIVMALSILISASGTHSRISTFRKPVERPRRSLMTVVREMRETLGGEAARRVGAAGVRLDFRDLFGDLFKRKPKGRVK